MSDPTPITPAIAETMGTFSEHRKVATTRISDFTVPPGIPYQTPEGLRAEDEPTRIAFDVQGGVYPIRESVFLASYAALSTTPAPDEERLRIERTARFQDALDALDLATLWLHRRLDLPHMPSHQASSWERKARSGRAALRAALEGGTHE